jgi:hypothetical protein
MQASVPAADPTTAQQKQTAAWERIAQLARGDTAVALDSLLVLAHQAVSRTAAATQGTNLASPTEAAGETNAAPATPPIPGIPPVLELAAAIDRHPLAQPNHKLFAVDLRLSLDPSQREQMITEAISTWQNADATGLAALAAWLNGKGEHERLLATLTLERAMQSADTFLQYVDALGGLGRWEEIRTLLESERFPLDPLLQRMYLARCNAQLGQKAAADNNWQRALEAASGDVGKMMRLADYAEKNGVKEIASAAYDAAAAESSRSRSAQQGRLRMAQLDRDIRRMHAVLLQMLDHWPKDAAVQNDEAYLRLLLMTSSPSSASSPASASDSQPAGAPNQPAKPPDGASEPFDPATGQPIPANTNAGASEIAVIEQLAQELVERTPASLPHRTLLALARLKQNEPVGALEVYANLQVPQNALTPSAVAVHAAVLAANGHFEDAKAEAGQIPADSLLPEERALVESLL